MDKDRPCVCITGPTACGKTELAIQLAEEFPLEIISMDSAMVYRGMDIGTAKPSQAVRKRVPHHLIDIVEPTETYSAGKFAGDARDVLGDICRRGRIPLLVGGTLLYLRAFRDGLAALPKADSQVRQRLDEEAEAVGWAALHKRLRSVDPDAAERIAPTDRQRIQRALEVHELTGQSLTALHHAQNAQGGMPVLPLALVPEDRVDLADKIERRFDSMVSVGLVEEVEVLRARDDLRLTTPAMRAVGYRQVWSFLEGVYGWEEARMKAIVATRQLAKRQMTWLRSDSKIKSLPAQGDKLLEEVRNALHAIVD